MQVKIPGRVADTRIKTAASALGIAAAGAILAELAVSSMLGHSAMLEVLPREALRAYYMESDRKILQYLPECARYDPELTYTLRPGRCRFRNREFDVAVDVNRLGVRDDEASLLGPEIIVLGDSHALGWGVEQHQTFAQLLEAETGRRVLNAAMSSYGTVRELGMLARADRRALRDLVLQYCDNDFWENQSFHRHRGSLPITSRDEYELQARRHRERTEYYPGKHVISLARRLARRREPADDDRDRPREIEFFLHALERSPVDLGGIRILVFELVGRGRTDDRFVDALERRLTASAAGKAPPVPFDLVPVRLAGVLAPRHYYLLDDHMTARGHRVVAETLLPLLRRAPGAGGAVR